MKRSTLPPPWFGPLEPRLLLSGCPVVPALSKVAPAARSAAVSAALHRGVKHGNRDAVGDTLADALARDFGRHNRVHLRGRIDYPGDVDVVSLVAPASGTVNVRFQMKGRHRRGAIAAYDAAGNLLTRAEEVGRRRAVIDFDVAEGQRYYLKMTGLERAQGHYAAYARFTEAPTPVNHAPVAGDDAYSVDEDGALTVSPGVLANDTDADGDAMTATLVDDVSNGTLALGADGTFTYTPNADFFGTDRFTYRAGDGTDESNPATVEIEVRPVNDAPVAKADAFTVDEDGVLAEAEGVLANDLDAEGDPLTVELVSDVAHGILSLGADGTFTYTPDADFHGEDRFTYRVSDGAATSNPAAVTITVKGINDAPVAKDDGFDMNQGESLELAPAGALANDSDADGDALALVLVDGPAHGTVEVGPDGRILYTPDAGFTGADTLTYRASDGTAESNLATVTINVASSNHAPVANDDVYTVVAGDVLTVPSPGVLANDTDADGDMLFALVISDVSHGTLLRDPLGGFTYIATAGFTGTDSFEYMAVDQDEFSNVATVTINVVPFEDQVV